MRSFSLRLLIQLIEVAVRVASILFALGANAVISRGIRYLVPQEWGTAVNLLNSALFIAFAAVYVTLLYEVVVAFIPFFKPFRTSSSPPTKTADEPR